MKNVNKLFCKVITGTVVPFFMTGTLFATPQQRELIIYEGARHFSNDLPTLEEALPNYQLPEFTWESTANWKGYSVTWAICDKQLYLIGVEGIIKEGLQIKQNSSQLFPSFKFPHKITGYTGTIELPDRGDYEFINGDRVHTVGITLKLKNGIVTDTTVEKINRTKEKRDKGNKLLKKSGYKDKLEKQFTLSKVEYLGDNCSTGGVHFPWEVNEWHARLKPIKTSLQKWEVRPIFPVIDNKLQMTLTVNEVVNAMEECQQHPFIVKRFKEGGATGLRARITGDRLHWDTKGLQKLHKKLHDKEIAQPDIKYWLQVVIDAKEPRYTTVFFNSKTGKMLFED